MSDITIGYQHVSVPAEVFLGHVMAGVGSLKGVRVERPGPNNVTIYHRYTPGWAVLVGILGLFVFLLGALLWFIKRTDTISVIAQDAEGGCGVTISGSGPPEVVMYLTNMVGGESERIYVAQLQPVVVSA